MADWDHGDGTERAPRSAWILNLFDHDGSPRASTAKAPANISGFEVRGNGFQTGLWSEPRFAAVANATHIPFHCDREDD